MFSRRVAVVAAVSVSFLLFSARMYAQQQGGAPTGRNILMICGDENRRVLPCTSISDVFVKNHLEIDMGHKVTRIPHDAEGGEMLAAANAADLVILAESLLSATVGTKVVSTPTPVLSYEAFLPDEFGLINPEGERMDPGTPDQGDYGAIEDHTTINIVHPKHPLAAGMSGRVQVLSRAKGDELGRGSCAQRRSRSHPAGLSEGCSDLRHSQRRETLRRHPESWLAYPILH